MKRWTLPIILLLIINSVAISQQTKSKILLKNGVLMKGEIIEFVQDDSLIMRVMDGTDLRIPANYGQALLLFSLWLNELDHGAFLNHKA